MRHLLIIKEKSARLACGPTIDAYFPMTSQAPDPSGIGKIDVALNPENATCEKCGNYIHHAFRVDTYRPLC
jgi:hypothetical protein